MAGRRPELNASGRQSAHGALPEVAIVLSQQLACLRPGLDLTALHHWCATQLPGVTVFLTPSLIKDSGTIEHAMTMSHAKRLVLGLVSGEDATREVQILARKAGLDPFGVHVVDLGVHAARYPHQVALERAKLLLAAAVAKVRAYPGSKPEHVKATLSVTKDRRAVFTLALHEYRTAPAILYERCTAPQGCRLCVDVCPRQAIRVTATGIELDKGDCESCGLCVTACAWDAMDWPGYSQEELNVFITTLLQPHLAELTPRGILFFCQRSAKAMEQLAQRGWLYPEGWLPVIVPCIGMLSPRLFLRCLRWGATGVGIVPCDDSCPFGQSSAIADRVSFCRRLLELLHVAPDRIALHPFTETEAPSWPLPSEPIRFLNQNHDTAQRSAHDPRLDVEALLALAEAHGAPADLAFSHPASPFGVIELRPDGCTACQACVSVCPTGALASLEDGSEVALSFDATQCVACGACVSRCPEAEHGVLCLHRTVDLRRLRAGRTVLCRDQTPRCQACGAPIAPAGMLSRIADLLGLEFAPLAATITRYCARCRGGPGTLS